jgi:hypothetical protein
MSPPVPSGVEMVMVVFRYRLLLFESLFINLTRSGSICYSVLKWLMTPTVPDYAQGSPVRLARRPYRIRYSPWGPASVPFGAHAESRCLQSGDRLQASGIEGARGVLPPDRILTPRRESRSQGTDGLRAHSSLTRHLCRCSAIAFHSRATA